MSHALVEWLDPGSRADRRFGRRPKEVKPLEERNHILEDWHEIIYLEIPDPILPLSHRSAF
jgi:hypothetical protein